MNRLDVFHAVEDDLVLREMVGFEQHKKPLLADDPGRDWLQEAYEEALDMAVYLKAEILRRREGAGSMERGTVERRRRGRVPVNVVAAATGSALALAILRAVEALR